MSYEQTYTLLDGTWHAIGWSEHTMCGMVIPFGNGYVTVLPDGKKAHCGPDTKIDETEAKKPDPAASSAAADEQNAAKAGVPVEAVAPAGEVGAAEVASPKGAAKGK